MGTWCRGSAGISKVVRPLEIKDHLCTCMGGVSTTMCNHVQEANQLRWEDCTQCSCFQKVVSETGKTGAGGESCNSPMRRARLRSRTTASSRMCHIASSCTSYMHDCVFSNTWVPMQSGNETNDPLKSGPAKAGLARPATPPLWWSSYNIYSSTLVEDNPWWSKAPAVEHRNWTININMQESIGLLTWVFSSSDSLSGHQPVQQLPCRQVHCRWDYRGEDGRTSASRYLTLRQSHKPQTE